VTKQLLAAFLLIMLGLHGVLFAESPQDRLKSLHAQPGVWAGIWGEIGDADTTGILPALETDPRQAGMKYLKFVEDLDQRVRRLQNIDAKHSPPSIGELSLLMLAGLDPKLPMDPRADRELAYGVIHQSFKPLMNEIVPRWALLKELLKAWMKARLYGSREYAWMAKQYGLAELAPNLATVVLDPKIDGEVRFNHLWPLADLGGDAEMVKLLPMLDKPDLVPDSRLPPALLERGPQSPQQSRDVVLGVLVRKSGEKLADYGFKYPNDGLMPTNPGIDFVFRDDEARQKALAKWKSRVVKVATTEGSQPSRALPPLPGKAPVFAIITKVDESAGTINYFLLYDEVVITEKFFTDVGGKTSKTTSDRVMTSLVEEKVDRPLKGSVVSTGDGQVIPTVQALKLLPGKLVLFCDDFEGLHPTYRKMLAKDTLILEVEKPRGLREAE